MAEIRTIKTVLNVLENSSQSVRSAKLIKLLDAENKTIYPITTAKAVIVFNDQGQAKTLDTVLKPLNTIDKAVTKNSNNLITSGAVYNEFERTVGEIYTNLDLI